MVGILRIYTYHKGRFSLIENNSPEVFAISKRLIDSGYEFKQNYMNKDIKIDHIEIL